MPAKHKGRLQVQTLENLSPRLVCSRKKKKFPRQRVRALSECAQLHMVPYTVLGQKDRSRGGDGTRSREQAQLTSQEKRVGHSGDVYRRRLTRETLNNVSADTPTRGHRWIQAQTQTRMATDTHSGADADGLNLDTGTDHEDRRIGEQPREADSRVQEGSGVGDTERCSVLTSLPLLC